MEDKSDKHLIAHAVLARSPVDSQLKTLIPKHERYLFIHFTIVYLTINYFITYLIYLLINYFIYSLIIILM